MMEPNYSNIETANAPPEASSMIETFRAIGYSIETAISDIIDNSITANSKNIWIDYEWKGSSTILSISDDGHGMNNKDLIQAMKPGSLSPLEMRKENDLGRFGLGLKTASFSQCRKFAVLSLKEKHPPCCWCWDLDFVNKQKNWTLIKYCPNQESYTKKLLERGNGTTVVWWNIDRLTSDTSIDNETSRARFLSVMDSVKKHIGMVFHQFLDEGLNIFLQQRKINPWDPFMIGVEGLQVKPESVFENGKVRIRGFILPHRSKLLPEQYLYGKGPLESWNAHQGFYIYRNKRLLVSGDWLGLFKKETHYDLCRIRIELTNDLDGDWQIDIKKSIARPPSRLRETIYAIAKNVREQAVEVYRHKGKVIKRKLGKEEYLPLWEERTRHGKRFYKINRNHPLIKNAGIGSFNLEQLLQFIEETVPVPLIMLQESESERLSGQPFEGKSKNIVLEAMETMYHQLMKQGITPSKAKSQIANTEPFNFYLEHLEKL